VSAERIPALHRFLWVLMESGIRSAGRAWPVAERLIVRPATEMVVLPDGSITINDPSDYVARQLYRGGYERAERWAMRRLVRRGGQLVDVGANLGAFTMLGARLVGEGGVVVAFEPGPALAPLRRLIATTGETNVEIIPAAVGITSGIATLSVPAHQPGLATLRPGAERLDETTVEVLRLDECGALRPGEIDLLKIDTEGFEQQVLAGAAGLFAAGRVRATLLELSPQWGPISFVRRFAESHGLSTVALGYRVGVRVGVSWRPVIRPYDEDQVLRDGQTSVLLLRSDIEL
jgi:FkbM family methyltransferase